MSETKRKVPKLRFPGFTEDWEQCKLGEIATVTGGGTPSTNISEYWNGDIDWYSPVEIGENRYVSGSIRKITKLGLEKSSAKILPVGTVLFTSRAGIGNTAILQVEGCTNQGFQSITPNLNDLDTYFLYTMTPKLKRYGEITGAGSTFVEVSGKQMEQMNLMVPSLEEQKRVGELFKTMDDAITLHQRKLENLKLKKKALLQKLFPKNGEQFPELRFPGFTDAWEQRKFGEVFEYERPDAYIVKSDNYSDEYDMPVLTANKAFVLGYTEEKNSYDNPSIIFDDFTLDRKFVDFPYMLKSSAIKILTAKIENDLRFLFERLNSTRFEVLGHARHYISVVQNTDTLCPSFDEQTCISKFLENFDNLITLHQRKLEHLQLQKKALLQQMFV